MTSSGEADGFRFWAEIEAQCLKCGALRRTRFHRGMSFTMESPCGCDSRPWYITAPAGFLVGRQDNAVQAIRACLDTINARDVAIDRGHLRVAKLEKELEELRILVDSYRLMNGVPAKFDKAPGWKPQEE